eukprot:GILJ01009456.1.p1 GENE.GILJ01009456.1~~GILJ01009456.1.p1  ORF type:complete len:273 (-),score=20.80 GILJ01009456.1:102-920(-)
MSLFLLPLNVLCGGVVYLVARKPLLNRIVTISSFVIALCVISANVALSCSLFCILVTFSIGVCCGQRCVIPGVSGGIACGKSSVDRVLIEKGWTIIDTDDIAARLVRPGSPALRKIVDTFGNSILRSDGTLDRELLGSMIFSSSELRRKLNAILHWRIGRDIFLSILKLKLIRMENQVVLDAPLLLESFVLRLICRPVVLVEVPEEIQVERLMKRNHLPRQAAIDRIHAQMPSWRRRQLADIVVDNSGSLEDLRMHVQELHSRLKSTVHRIL